MNPCSTGRRLFLHSLGGAAWLVAGGCSPFYWPERGVAFEPWDFPDLDLEPHLRLVHAATLAASPHNSQPWAFHASPERIDVFADSERALGSVDPFLREMHVGLGCALENVLVAAAHEGFRTDVTLMPAPDNGHVASIQLGPGGSGDAPLFDAIARRHTNRGRFGNFDLDPGITEALHQHASGSDLALFALQGSALSRWRSGTVDATEAFVASDLNAASHAWFRHSADDIAEHRDGLTHDAAGLGSGLRFFGKTGRPIDAETMGSYWIRSTQRVHTSTGSGFFALCCRDRHDRVQQLNAGRAWQRTHLWCAANGVNAHPLSQIIELADDELIHDRAPVYGDRMAELVPDAWDPQMFFRVGFAIDDAPASPRRPLGWVTEDLE